MGQSGIIWIFQGVGDQIFAHFYSQNKKIAEPGGSADPLPTPLQEGKLSKGVSTAPAAEVVFGVS